MAMDVSPEAQIELYSIFEFVRFAHSLQIKDILAFVGMKLERLIPFDAAVFYLVDLDNDAVTPSHVIGKAAESIPTDTVLPLDQKLSGWVAANNQALSNLPPFPDFRNFSSPKPQFEMSAIAPMNESSPFLVETLHGSRLVTQPSSSISSTSSPQSSAPA